MARGTMRSKAKGGATQRARPRRCAVSRERRARADMIRFVVDPEGRVAVDILGRLPGRGLWLSADRDVVNRAVARNMFARALARSAAGVPVRADPELGRRVEERLAARCLDLIGLARRAGQVVTGHDQVEAALRAGRVALLLAARDGAAAGRRRLRALAPELPLLCGFDRGELGGALGRDEVVHAALLPGGLARRLLEEAARLEGFRPGGLETAPEGAPASRNEEPARARNEREEHRSP
jgi:uncharacterized protein